jgi:hypothetical protein
MTYLRIISPRVLLLRVPLSLVVEGILGLLGVQD